MKTIQPVLGDHGEAAKTVVGAANEIDAAGLREISHRHGNVAQPEAETHRLDEQLSVENKVVGIVLEGNPLKNFSAVDAEAAVEIAQILP